MKYTLYKEIIPEFSACEQILYNRGIPIDEQMQWLYADWDKIYDWTNLDINLMENACVELLNAINAEKDVIILVDSDCDGYTSSAILLNYLYKRFPEYTVGHVSYIHHEGKQHGFSDVIDEIIERKPYLVISPDGGSNDIAQHKKMQENGIVSICLDHHDYDISLNDVSPCIIVNIQGIPEYPNKALTGAGVVYKFISAFEDLYVHGNQPTEFMDLCAIGNLGDMSTELSLETRAIVNIGLKEFRNPFLRKMADKNDYVLQKRRGYNYLSCAFGIVPFINAVTRSGTMEEKDIVFKGMLTQYAFDKVESSKRGHKGELVPLYEEAVLVAERVKRRQTKVQDEMMDYFHKKIKEENLLENKIILLLCEPGIIDRNIAGLCANKIQATYQKPAAILTLGEDGNYSGSMRNFSLSERKNLKTDLQNTGEIIFCQGHEGAAGLAIAADNINNFLDAFNEMYAEVEQVPSYRVDYIWRKNTIDENKILAIGEFNFYGQDVPESMVAIEDICLTPDMVTLMSKDKRPTLKIQIGNVSCIKFGSSEEEYERFCQEDMVLNFVATCNINEWNGQVSPQLIIEDYELREEMVF